MEKYKVNLFPNYIFFFDGKNLKIFSIKRNIFLKKYYSTLKKYWRYKLVTKFGHSLQFSERQFKHCVKTKGCRYEETRIY